MAQEQKPTNLAEANKETKEVKLQSTRRNVGGVFMRENALPSTGEMIQSYSIALNRDDIEKYSKMLAVNDKLTVHIGKTSEEIIAKTPDTPKFYAYVELNPEIKGDKKEIMHVQFDLNALKNAPIHVPANPDANYPRNTTYINLTRRNADTVTYDQDWVVACPKVVDKAITDKFTAEERKANRIYVGNATSNYNNLKFEEFASLADCTAETLQKNIDLANDRKVLAMISKSDDALIAAHSAKLIIPSNSFLCKNFKSKGIKFEVGPERTADSIKQAAGYAVEPKDQKVEFKKEASVKQEAKNSKGMKQ